MVIKALKVKLDQEAYARQKIEKDFNKLIEQ